MSQIELLMFTTTAVYRREAKGRRGDGEHGRLYQGAERHDSRGWDGGDKRGGEERSDPVQNTAKRFEPTFWQTVLVQLETNGDIKQYWDSDLWYKRLK